MTNEEFEEIFGNVPFKDIEKDIKRCEKLTEPQNANWIGISNQIAIGHVIERIKELEEKNKEILTSKIGIDLSYQDYIPKQKVKDLIENETINISGFECVAVEDLEELLEDK